MINNCIHVYMGGSCILWISTGKIKVELHFYHTISNMEF